MKTKFYKFFLIAVFLSTYNFDLFSNSNKENKLIIIVKLQNLKQNNGQIGINVFRNDAEMFQKPYISEFASVINNKAVFSIDNLALTEYVVVAFYDKNRNKKLDHHFLGFPNEPLGYSSTFKFGIFSGFPSFDKLKFDYKKKHQKITINIK